MSCDPSAVRMSFDDRFPGLVEVRENLSRWPKKPQRNDRYTLAEQRELLDHLFWLAQVNWEDAR